MDPEAINILLDLKMQIYFRIDKLNNLISEEKKTINHIQKLLKKHCKHEWVDDGTFDVQHYGTTWVCARCPTEKEN